MLTLTDMRRIILAENGSVAYQGKSISRANIHELPSEAEWAVAAGKNFDAVSQDLDKQIAELARQKQLVEEGKKASESKKPETKKLLKMQLDEPEAELVSSKPAK